MKMGSYNWLCCWMLCAAFLMSCSERKDQLAIPHDRVDWQKKAMAIPPEVLSACNTQISTISPGVSNETNDLLLSLIRVATPGKKSECASVLADFFLNSFESLANGVALTKREREEVDFDVLIVGAGVHGAIAARNLSARNPHLKIIMIDKDAIPASHFHTVGFRLNSPGLPRNTNGFPLSPVDINEHAEPVAHSQQAFPVARQLWNQIIFNSFASNAFISLKTDVVEVGKKDGFYVAKLTGPGLFSKERNIVVKKIIVATGLGVPIMPQSDDKNWVPSVQKDVDAAKSQVPKTLPPVINYDDLYALNDFLKTQGRPLFDFMGGKRIAVLGAGDSGKIAVEFLTGYAPLDCYQEPDTGIDTYKAPTAVLWFNQKNQDYAAFSSDPEVKSRYRYPGFNDIYAGTDQRRNHFDFITVDKKATKVSPKGGGVEVVSENGAVERVDFVVVAIGYRSVVNEFFSTKFSLIRDRHAPGQKLPFEPVKMFVSGDATFSDSYETVAEKLCLDPSNCEEIYLIGTAGADMIKVSKQRYNESLTKNPVSIETLSPLTAAFSQYLF